MLRYLKLFFRRILKDFKQRELLPLKFLFFMHSSTILVLYPYLTIHMRELGINVEETAIMSAVTPVVAILMPPLAGMIADKIGNFRVLLASFSVIGGCAALLLLLVPIGRITLTFPDRVVYGLTCQPNTSPVISLFQEYPCNRISEENIMVTDLKLESCGFVCEAPLNENYTKIIMTTRSYDVKTENAANNISSHDVYELSDADIFEPEPVSNTRYHKTLKMNQRYMTAVRRLSKTLFYFPVSPKLNFSCGLTHDASVNCIIGSSDELKIFPEITSSWSAGIRQRVIEHEDFEDNIVSFNIEHIDSKNNNNITCLDNQELDNKVTVTVPLELNDTESVKQLDLAKCHQQCILSSPRQQVCSNLKTTIEIDMSVTFWSYLCVRVFVGIISGTSFAMFEGAVIAILREHKADYGLQRIYATFGGMISSPVSGWLIDFASRGKGYTDFRPIFFLYAGLKIVSGILMLFINLEFKKAAASVITDVLSVLKKVELIALFISCVILGSAWGFIESFLFWLLDDLGASKSLMGLTVTIGGSVGIPLLVLSGPIIKKLGHANVIFIGFIFYAIRLLGYSLLYNPWLCLIFEAMESITFGLSFTAAVTYAAKLSTVTTDTSIQGMLGGLYYGVGKGIGSLIGGYLIEPIGIRHTFQAFAVATAIIGLIYLSFYHLYMKKHPSQGTDITKKDSIKPEIKEDIDLKSKADLADIQSDLPMVFEDALCNPAYETTEVENEHEPVDSPKVNGQI